MNLFRNPKFLYSAAAEGVNAGGGAAPATSPVSVVPPAAAPAAAASTDWTSGLSEDSKGWVGNKQYKTINDAIDAHRGLEKLLGAPKDRLLTLPERFYDDQGKLTAEGRAVREKIGAPKDAKEYNLTAPKEGADPKLLEHFRGVFHELGIPKADAEKITGSWNAYVEQQTTSQKEAAAQTFKNQQSELAKDWGAALEQNTNIARDAVKAMGFDEKKVAALSAVLGHTETMKLFHKLGSQVREAPFIGGQRSNEVLEPVNARAQIKELLTDKSFGKLLESGDRDAKAKWEWLHQQAFPGEYRVS